MRQRILDTALVRALARARAWPRPPASLVLAGLALAALAGLGAVLALGGDDVSAGSLVAVLALATLGLAALTVRRSRQLELEVLRRRYAEHQAQSLARHDHLTGLANREAMLQRLDGHIRSAPSPAEASCAVLIVALDRFRRINDVHGHAAGDKVLQMIGTRLRNTVCSKGSVGRIGGDEFAIVLPPGSDAAACRKLAKRLLAVVEEGLDAGEFRTEVTCSIGIAMAPTDGRTCQALMDHADMAMYRAKEIGRNCYAFFEEKLNAAMRERAEAAGDLRRALRDGEIVPFFQPCVDIRSGRLLGFEVLARWMHPQRGLVSPALFIPIAEQNGLIGEICTAVLRQACEIARHWPSDLRIAVNISPTQFNDRWLAQKIVAVLAQTGFPAGRLEVEVTETALVADGATARDILSALKNQGVRIALDDFGTGYSCMQSLLELPLDKVKIDRSFVTTCTTSPESRKIVAAIVGLSRSLGLPTTAEGIELPAHAEFLLSLGCAEGQGYLYAKPLPADRAGELASGWQAVPPVARPAPVEADLAPAPQALFCDIHKQAAG